MQLTADARERLKQARDASGLSQSQAAIAIGKAKISVARWEGGARFPREEDVQLLSELYQVNYDWIVDKEAGAKPEPTLERKRHARDCYNKMKAVSETVSPLTPLRRALNRGTDRGYNELLPEEAAASDTKDILQAMAFRLTYLLSIRSKLPTVPQLSPEVVQAIADGKVIPVMGFLSRLSATLGVDEEWLRTGNRPNRADVIDQPSE